MQKGGLPSKAHFAPSARSVVAGTMHVESTQMCTIVCVPSVPHPYDGATAGPGERQDSSGQSEAVAGQTEPVAGQSKAVAGQNTAALAGQTKGAAGQTTAVAGQNLTGRSNPGVLEDETAGADSKAGWKDDKGASNSQGNECGTPRETSARV